MKGMDAFFLFFLKVIYTPMAHYSCAYKKCLFQFPASTVYEFFSGDFFDLKKRPFSMSEFAGFKNIYMSIYKKKLA